MRNLFRNPELIAQLLIWLLLWVLAAGVGLLVSPACCALMAVAGLLFGAFHFTVSFRRYRKIRGLCRELERALLDQPDFSLADYREGELSILQIELEKLTTRLRENAEQLQKDKLFLRDAIADVSHQLRTPLTSLNLLASMLAASSLPADERAALTRRLQTLLGRIDWLIDALLKLSRLDAGAVSLKADTLDLKSVLQRAAQPLAIAMELREQTLRLHGSAHCLGDADWSAEAFGCILKNCMEHTPAGGVIDVALADTPLFASVTVHDSGPGLRSEDIPHLFERFYKGKSAAADSFGIGLSLAQKIIQHQNGVIRADNHPDGGARFTVRFYRRRTEQ